MALLDDDQMSGTGVTPKSIESMRGTTTWMTTMAVFGFIAVTYYVVMMLQYAQYLVLVGGGFGIFMLVVAFGIIGVLGWSFVLLFQYSNGLKKFVATKQSTDLEYALEKQRLYWTVLGCFTIASIIISIFSRLIIA